MRDYFHITGKNLANVICSPNTAKEFDDYLATAFHNFFYAMDFFSARYSNEKQ